MSDGLDMAGSARSGTGGRRDAMDLLERLREHAGHRLSVMTGEDISEGLMCDTCGEYVWEDDDEPATGPTEGAGSRDLPERTDYPDDLRGGYDYWRDRAESLHRALDEAVRELEHRKPKEAVSVTDEMVQVAREEIVRVGARQMSPNAMRRVLRAALGVPDGG